MSAAPVSASRPVSRRGFLLSTLTAGAWTLGPGAWPGARAQPAASTAAAAKAAAAEADAEADANAGADAGATPTAFGTWLRLFPDGSVTVLTNISDIGQGTQSTLAQIVAEELEVPLARIRVELAPVLARYANVAAGSYGTFGSIGFRTAYTSLAPVSAAARNSLVQAAAAKWGVPADQCRAHAGRVQHDASARSVAYGSLLTDAAARVAPDKPALKPRDQWTVLGRSAPRHDIPAKTDGSAIYGIDVHRPGLLVACVLHAPTFGGRLLSVPAAPALAIQGVRQVVPLPGSVAVVADGYWPAQQGLQALAPRWQPGPHAAVDSEALSAALLHAAAAGGGRAFAREDDPRIDAAATDAALALASRVIDIRYEVPFLAHAPMEPLNATAEVQADSAQLWLSTQSQSDTQRAVAAALGLRPEQVLIHSQTAGGGFGRRLEHDFAVEAALIARAAGPGRPVKTIWSREVDMRSGFYRPAAAARVRLALDEQQAPVALRVDMAHPSLLEHTGLALPADRHGLDTTATMGWVQQSYAIPALHLTWTRVEQGVPCGFWRAVGASQNTFFFESTLDRAARSAGIDPVAYRRRLLAASPRALAFVDALAARAGWDQPAAPGRFRGFAMSEANRAIGGHVVEISVPAPGRFRIERITAAIDAGWVGNPDAVQAQVMGATLFGLSAALFGEITLEKGRVVQGNFDGYPILKLAQTPPLDIVVLANGDRAAGVGEECTPSVAPALAAALLAASGQPVTRLPLSRAGWQLAD